MISDERDKLLDTGGGVVKALAAIGSEPFFHVNSDTIWIDGVKPNLERLAEAFDPATMDALLLLAPVSTSIGYAGRGDFTMAADGRLTRRGEREVAPFVYAGAAILRPELFKDAPAGAFSLTTLFDRAAASRPAAWAAARRRVDARRHARGHRARPRRRSPPARRDAAAGLINSSAYLWRLGQIRIARIARAMTQCERHGPHDRASSRFRRRRRSCRR